MITKTATALSYPFFITTLKTVHALRTLLGGVWAKKKTPETDAHLVQDNWRRVFAWRCALIEMTTYL